MPIISLRENPLAGWPTVYKRVFDMGGALFGLALFGLPHTGNAQAQGRGVRGIRITNYALCTTISASCFRSGIGGILPVFLRIREKWRFGDRFEREKY